MRIYDIAVMVLLESSETFRVFFIGYISGVLEKGNRFLL